MLIDTAVNHDERRLAKAVERVTIYLAAEPEAAGVFERATTAFMRELLGLRDRLTTAARDRQLLSLDDKTLVAELLIQALEEDPLTSKTLRLQLRGQLALRHLLDQHGDTLTTSEVAQLLDITPDAVRKRSRRGGLLALPRGGHSVFPVFQFDVEAGRVLPGLDEILLLLDTDSAPAKVRFFLTPDRDLDQTPIDALRNAGPKLRALLVRKAQQFDQQLAA